MACFQLLQATDLHITVPPEPDDIGSLAHWMFLSGSSRARLPVLKAVAEFAFSKRKELDAIVISGDLSDDGERENLDKAKEFVDARARFRHLSESRFPTLGWCSQHDVRVLLLPGNHDRFNGPLRLPGGTIFDDVFQPHWHKGIGGVQAAVIKKKTECLALVFADFCVPKLRKAPQGVWGQGLVGDNSLSNLESMTESLQLALPTAAILWILHFPPFLEGEWRFRLRGASKVLDAAARLGIKHIISGHLHRNQTTAYSDVEVVCTGSSASEYRSRHGNFLRLLRVDTSHSNFQVSSTLFKYKAATQSFGPP
jgi:DNA repair exonuclease SbcCD nuclease subunit